MEVFEIHITGDKKIISAAKELSLKTIVLDLVKPDRSYYRTEYMTSQVHHAENYQQCKDYVDEIVGNLLAQGVDIKRVKIECAYIKKYKDQSIYFEVHYRADNNLAPMSQNHGKDYFLATAREYDKDKYDSLWQKHGGIFLFTPPDPFVMELCLYDTNVEEDKDWFDLYEQRPRKKID
jgi:hypothetical protein